MVRSKKFRQLAFVLLVVIFPVAGLTACTSFSCYSGQTWYGMNFDYPQRSILFRIVQEQDCPAVLEMGFHEEGNLCRVYGFNTNGQFSTCQMLYPPVSSFDSPGSDEITLFDAWIFFLRLFPGVPELLDYLETGDSNGTGIHVIQGPPITIHCMMSDPSGNAIVLETSDEENMITPAQDGILVMTNFANHLFAGQPYTEVSGVGADRYITAWQIILDNFESFDYEMAWETLSQTIQHSGGFPTQCSTVFDPEGQVAYIALHRNLERIWRVRMDERMIETFEGFDTYSSLPLDENGVTAEQLLAMVGVDGEQVSPSSLSVSAYPNPFNPTVTIQYGLKTSGTVGLTIHNARGQLIRELFSGHRNPGEHTLVWDGLDQQGRQVSTGVYLIRMSASDGREAVGRISLVK